jgi:hypothetical protein
MLLLLLAAASVLALLACAQSAVLVLWATTGTAWGHHSQPQLTGKVHGRSQSRLQACRLQRRNTRGQLRVRSRQVAKATKIIKVRHFAHDGCIHMQL